MWDRRVNGKYEYIPELSIHQDACQKVVREVLYNMDTDV